MSFHAPVKHSHKTPPLELHVQLGTKTSHNCAQILSGYQPCRRLQYSKLTWHRRLKNRPSTEEEEKEAKEEEKVEEEGK